VVTSSYANDSAKARRSWIPAKAVTMAEELFPLGIPKQMVDHVWVMDVKRN
jgi:hypothetical protein